MGKITQKQVQKRNVFCNKCLREYSSSVQKPICGNCRSSNVVDASSISDKMALKVMERDVNARLDNIDQVLYDLQITIDHIQKRLDSQWEAIGERFDKQWVHVSSIYKHLKLQPR